MYGKSILKFGVIWIIAMVIMIVVTNIHKKNTQELAEKCDAETQYVVSDVDVKKETKRVKRNGKYRTETETNYVVTFDYEVEDTLYHTTKKYSSDTHSVGEVGTIYYDSSNPSVCTFVSLEGMENYNKSLTKTRFMFGGFMFIVFTIMTVVDINKKRRRYY